MNMNDIPLSVDMAAPEPMDDAELQAIINTAIVNTISIPIARFIG